MAYSLSIPLFDSSLSIWDSTESGQGHIDGNDVAILNGLPFFIDTLPEKTYSQLTRLMGQPLANIMFGGAVDYINQLKKMHDRAIPNTLKQSPLTDDMSVTTVSLLQKIRSAALMTNIDDSDWTTPEIMQWVQMAKETPGLAKHYLETITDKNRRELLTTLIADYAIIPRRSYQPNMEDRIRETLVGHKIAGIENNPDYSIGEWAALQSPKLPKNGWMSRPDNACGVAYFSKIVATAKKMGRTPAAENAYFSSPESLVFFLRSVVSPKEIYKPDLYRYYHPAANFSWEDEHTASPVTFYAREFIIPHSDINSQIKSLLALVSPDYNPIRYIIFTPEMSGSRHSIAEQGRLDITDPYPIYFGFDGDYFNVGLDWTKCPACTFTHENGHQKWWQLVERPDGTEGEVETAIKAQFHELYCEAMKTDGAELINDETYTTRLGSGHPWIFGEFFAAAYHAFVLHNRFLKSRTERLPPENYGHRLWQAMNDYLKGTDTTGPYRFSSSSPQK